MENGICPRSGTFPFAWIISFLLMFIGFYPRVGNPNTYWTIIWIIWSNQTIGGGIDIPLPFFWIVTLNLGLRTADPSSSAEYPSNTPNTWHANGTKGGNPPWERQLVQFSSLSSSKDWQDLATKHSKTCWNDSPLQIEIIFFFSMAGSLSKDCNSCHQNQGIPN